MLTVWSDYENVMIPNVGVLLLFGMVIVWVRYKVHDVKIGPGL